MRLDPARRALGRVRRLGRSARIAIIVLVITLAIAGGVVTMVLYQIGTGYIDNPRFCGTCHIMAPFVEAWETSVHGQTFVKCHLCHETGYETALRVATFAVGAYKTPIVIDFPNQQISQICSNCHVRSGLHMVDGHVDTTCRTCHGMHGPGIEVPTSPACIKCHAGVPGYMFRTSCIRCHTREQWGSPVGHIAKVDGTLPFELCSNCHVMVKLHDSHSQIQCSACHTHGGFQGIIPKQETCISCHPEMAEKFPGHLCNECHTRHAWGGRKIT